MLFVGYGSEDNHARAVAGLRAAVPPTFTFDTPIPHTALQQMFDDSAPWGIRGYEKAVYLDELSDPVIDTMAQYVPEKQSPMSFMPMFVLGGRYAERSDDDTAFGGSRRCRYALNIAALGSTPELLDADRQWVRDYWSALVPHAAGAT